MGVRRPLRWVPDDTGSLRDIDPYTHWLLIHGRPFLPNRRSFSHVAMVPTGGLFDAVLKPDHMDVLALDEGHEVKSSIEALVQQVKSRDAGAIENTHIFLIPLSDQSVSGLAGRIRALRGPARTVPPKDEIDPTRPLVITGVIDDHINVFHNRFTLDGATRVDFAWFQDGERMAPTSLGVPPPVPFGREITKAEIDAVEAPDDALLRSFGLVDFGRAGANPLALRASHGTHVADIAAGSPGVVPRDKNWRVIAVSLPSLVTFDTSGATLGPCFLMGMQYIIRRARELAKAYERRVTLVINCSYGISGGPHDGQHFIEQAIAELIAPVRSDPDLTAGDPDLDAIHVVLPAGNSNLDRGHASRLAVTGEEQTELMLPWRIQPGDQTPSYLEIWMPAEAEDVEIAIRAPGAHAAQYFNALEGAMVLTDDGRTDPGGVAARLHRGTVGGRKRFVLVVAPTACLTPGVAVAPHGLWHVTARARIPTGARIEAWIQRDTSPVGAKVQGRQSYFDDPSYVRFDKEGRLRADDPHNTRSVARRRGTLNGIATGGQAVVVAGYVLGREGIDAASYSATGFGDGRDPTVAAVSDRSRVVKGVLAAGTLSGTKVAINGTSVAAPAIAREIARHRLEDGAEFPTLNTTALSDDQDLMSRVGVGWFASARI